MSLTKDDLQAIRDIVEDVVEIKVESAKRQTAAGFAEVHEKFAEVNEKFAEVHEKFAEVNEKFGEVHEKFAEVNEKLDSMQQTMSRIERVQRAEIERSDHQDVAIKNIRKVLHTA